MNRIVISILLFFCVDVAAETRFSGFGNVGVLTSDSDVLAYRNNMSQSYGTFDNDLDFRTNTKVGFQVEWTNQSDWDAVYQGMLHETRDSKLSDYVRLAFIRYRPSASYSARVGRIPLDTFLITEYRDVDYAFPWAKAPNSVYGTIPYFYVDGFDFSYVHQFNDFSLTAKLFAGESSAQIGDYKMTERVDLDQITGLSFELQSFNWMISAKLSRGRFGETTAATEQLLAGFSTLQPIWPSVTNDVQTLELKDKKANYGSLGGRYDIGNVTLYGEVTNVRSDSDAISNLRSAYLSAAYRFNDIQVFGTIGRTSADQYTFTGFEDNNIDVSVFPIETQMLMAQLKAGAEGLANYFASNQTATSIGARWDFTDNMALKVQLEQTNIEENGATLWLKHPDKPLVGEQTVNTLFVNVSFVF